MSYNCDQWYLSLYMISKCLWAPLNQKCFLFIFKALKIFFILLGFLYCLDFDANFTASYPNQLGIRLNSFLVPVFSRSRFCAYSLKTKNVYPEIGIALFYPILQICNLKCTFQSILFLFLCSLKLSWIWMDERQNVC